MKIGQKVTVKNEGVHPEDHMHGEWYIAEICRSNGIGYPSDIGISRTKDAALNDIAEWFVNVRRINEGGAK